MALNDTEKKIANFEDEQDEELERQAQEEEENKNNNKSSSDLARKVLNDKKSIENTKKTLETAKKVGQFASTLAKSGFLVEVLPWILGGLAVIAIIILIASCIPCLGGNCGRTGTNGVNPVENRDEIQQLLTLSGDKEARIQTILTKSQTLKDNLVKLQTKTTDQKVKDKAQEIINQLNDLIAVKSGEDELRKEKAVTIEALYGELEKLVRDGRYGQIDAYDNPTNKYGYINPVEGNGKGAPYNGDDGLDINTPRGTYVRAIADGTIAYTDMSGAHVAKEWRGAGNDIGSIGLNLDDGNYAFYTHLSDIDPNLHAGSKVKKGQIIGKTGIANNSPHLHISIAPYRASGNEWLSIAWKPNVINQLWF